MGIDSCVIIALMDSENAAPAPQTMQVPPKKSGAWGVFREIVQFLVISFVLVFGLRTFVAQPFIVSGSSMDPTFANGQYLIVDEVTYRFREPQRGEVIIFRYPKDTSKFFIKRVVGLPGETVIIQKGKVSIRKGDETQILEEPYTQGLTVKDMSRNLGSEEFFVLGDNREASSDSRIWGPVDRKYVVGRAFFRLLPVTYADVLPGDYSNQLE